MIKETLCEHCVFKIQDVTGKQIGCELGRLDKMKHGDRGNFKVIDGYCSACRNIYWKAANEFEQIYEMIEAVKKEIRLDFDIVVNVDEVATRDELAKTIEFINKFVYKPRKTLVILGSKSEFSDMINGLDKSFEFVVTLDGSSIKDTTIDRIKLCKSSHLMFTYPGAEINDAIVYEFNKALNEDLNPMATYSSDGCFFCPTFLYKHFMYSDNPFESIIEYVKPDDTNTADTSCEHNNSEL